MNKEPVYINGFHFGIVDTVNCRCVMKTHDGEIWPKDDRTEDEKNQDRLLNIARIMVAGIGLVRVNL